MTTTGSGAITLTNDPAFPVTSTPLYDEHGNEIAEWVSSYPATGDEAVEVGEAMKWATRLTSKWLEWRRGK